MYDNITEDINRGSIQNPYKEFTFTLAAGARTDIFYDFSYFRVMSLSGASLLSVVFGGTGAETSVIGAGVGIDLPAPVNKVQIVNNDVTTMTITVALSMGRINDDRLNISGNVSVINASGTNLAVRYSADVLQSLGSVLVSNAALTTVISGAADQTSWIIMNAGTERIYLVSASVSVATAQASGMPLDPGEKIMVDGSFVVRATGTSATSNDVRYWRMGRV